MGWHSKRKNHRDVAGRMRQSLWCYWILAILGFLTVSAGASEELAPAGGSVLTLERAGQPSIYYRLPADSVLELKVSGPGTLTAVVRLALPAGFNRDSAQFRLVVTLGADTARDIQATTMADDGEWVGKTERPTLSQTLSLPVQEGRHPYRFHLSEVDGPYAGMQFLFKRAPARGSAASKSGRTGSKSSSHP